MKTKLLYITIILFSFNCRPHSVPPEKTRKVAVHIFTGKGDHDETTNWFYIRDVIYGGFSGYYLESTSKVNDFKHVNFVYSKTRPAKFEGQSGSEEEVQLLNPDNLPEDLQKDLPGLESLFE